jgi:predicted glycosyltransferase
LPSLSYNELNALRSLGATEFVLAKRAIRGAILSKILDELRPDVFIIEFFPFGRHAFAFELVPAIERARANGALVVSSVRDIACSFPSPREQAAVRRWLEGLFDGVLIHADPAFTDFAEHFRIAWPPNVWQQYTGFVARDHKPQTLAKAARRRVLCTPGGGKTGFALCNAMIDAAPILAKRSACDVDIVTGPFLAPERFSELACRAAGIPNLTLQQYDAELPRRFSTAQLCVSMGGYNTMIDAMRNNCYSLVLPFEAPGVDPEQRIRAERLRDLGRASILCEGDLSPAKLAGLIDANIDKRTAPARYSFDGAQRSATIIVEAMRSR